ncbi:hypothetical protein GGD54_004457 [Rhizobium tropici]|uniref:Uncharacterized protein n=1 Tax=Rhizobium tropici TaxID=398 RepID=A0ABR6R4B7_RHITR|nr:hypothetical protein [Rhizobium tropici]MBB5593328.1 hypothetical protein [Rhizobium tropici]MBB6494037.1 hypothetical protein [Rhizobium tropici]
MISLNKDKHDNKWEPYEGYPDEHTLGNFIDRLVAIWPHCEYVNQHHPSGEDGNVEIVTNVQSLMHVTQYFIVQLLGVL